MSSGTTRRSGDEVKERVARLMECVMSLRPLPQEVAGMKATLNAIKEKLDVHVSEKWTMPYKIEKHGMELREILKAIRERLDI